MPTFRSDIAALSPYQVGRQLDEVARELGLDPAEIVKLAANESPEGPFPGVVEAAARVLEVTNRYPDQDCWDLGHAMAGELGVDFSNILFGAGSVALLAELTCAVGGPGTNFVYGWPSFIMYRFASVWAGSKHVEVPLDEEFRIDLDALRDAIDDNTRAVILCNPNNPTGTIIPGDDIEAFVESVPESVLVVVDEAYHEYVTDPRYRTQAPLATQRPNLVVLRTFSKIYSLAALRVGYAVGHRDTITEVRKAQAPLTVNQVAQAAALASLGQHEELERRRSLNAARRHHLTGALTERGLPLAESQANFVFFHLGDQADQVVANMMAMGVITRGMSRGWVRVTIGDDQENQRFLEVLDEAVSPG